MHTPASLNADWLMRILENADWLMKMLAVATSARFVIVARFGIESNETNAAVAVVNAATGETTPRAVAPAVVIATPATPTGTEATAAPESDAPRRRVSSTTMTTAPVAVSVSEGVTVMNYAVESAGGC